jgi:hypothetical protein
VYNASRELARLWQFTHGKPSPFGLPPITQCTGGNNLVAPHTARREVSFGGGLRGSAAAEPRSSNRRHTACSTGLLPPCPIAAPTLEAITVPVTPGAAASLAVASWRDGVGVHLSTLIMPAVLLTTPDHGDGVHAADPPGLPGKR